MSPFTINVKLTGTDGSENIFVQLILVDLKEPEESDQDQDQVPEVEAKPDEIEQEEEPVEEV